MDSSCLHGDREVLHSRAQRWEILFRPGVFPRLTILPNEGVLERIREERAHVSVSSIEESELAMFPTNLVEMLGSLKFLSGLTREVSKLECLEESLAALFGKAGDSTNRQGA